MSSNEAVVGNWVGDSMDQGSSVYSMDSVDHRGVDSMDDWGVDSMDSMDSMDRSNSVSTSRRGGVLGLSRVSHLSDVAIVVVGVIVDSLDPAIGKTDGVGASHNTSAIVRLSLLEVGIGVVVSDGVGVGVGGGLGQVRSSVASLVDHGGSVLGGSSGGSHQDEGEKDL